MRIGIDLGGTQIRVALVDSDGRMKGLNVVKTMAKAGASAVLSQLVELISTLPDWQSADFIGLGIPAAVSQDGNLIQLASNLPGMDGYPLRVKLEQKLDRQVRIVNDANAACLGEACLGAGKGYQSIVYITLSTGIGGGYYNNGILLAGASGSAMELGSVSVDDTRLAQNDLPRGAIESEISGTAFIRRSHRNKNYRHAGDVFAAASEDREARHLKEDFLHQLTIVLSNLACIFNPDAFVLGGGIMASHSSFLMELTERYRCFTQKCYRETPILRASLEQPGVVGAAMLDRVTVI